MDNKSDLMMYNYVKRVNPIQVRGGLSIVIIRLRIVESHPVAWVVNG